MPELSAFMSDVIPEGTTSSPEVVWITGGINLLLGNRIGDFKHEPLIFDSCSGILRRWG